MRGRGEKVRERGGEGGWGGRGREKEGERGGEGGWGGRGREKEGERGGEGGWGGRGREKEGERGGEGGWGGRGEKVRERGGEGGWGGRGREKEGERGGEGEWYIEVRKASIIVQFLVCQTTYMCTCALHTCRRRKEGRTCTLQKASYHQERSEGNRVQRS